MASDKDTGFVQGLTLGAFGTLLVGLVLVYTLGAAEAISIHPEQLVEPVLGWAYRNLGLSLPFFGVVLVLFFKSLNRLKQELRAKGPVEEVAQAEQLTDTWTGLFFGIGVIWTAIGMRGALLYALGDPETTVANGAFAVLERMVDGGILLALSTTIFGGIGGYLMRVIKTVSVGATLRRYYEQTARAQSDDVHATLLAIKTHLESLMKHPRPGTESES